MIRPVSVGHSPPDDLSSLQGCFFCRCGDSSVHGNSILSTLGRVSGPAKKLRSPPAPLTAPDVPSSGAVPRLLLLPALVPRNPKEPLFRPPLPPYKAPVPSPAGLERLYEKSPKDGGEIRRPRSLGVFEPGVLESSSLFCNTGSSTRRSPMLHSVKHSPCPSPSLAIIGCCKRRVSVTRVERAPPVTASDLRSPNGEVASCGHPRGWTSPPSRTFLRARSPKVPSIGAYWSPNSPHKLHKTFLFPACIAHVFTWILPLLPFRGNFLRRGELEVDLCLQGLEIV